MEHKKSKTSIINEVEHKKSKSSITNEVEHKKTKFSIKDEQESLPDVPDPERLLTPRESAKIKFKNARTKLLMKPKAAKEELLSTSPAYFEMIQLAKPYNFKLKMNTDAHQSYHMAKMSRFGYAQKKSFLTVLQTLRQETREVESQTAIDDIFKGQTVNIPSRVDVAESIVNLREMLKAYVNSSLYHLNDLLKATIIVRTTAREEIEKIQEKKKSLNHLVKWFEWAIGLVKQNHTSVEMYSSDAGTINYEQKQSHDHECKFCVCHESPAGEGREVKTAWDDQEGFEAQYQRVVDTVVKTYVDCAEQLDQARGSVRSILLRTMGQASSPKVSVSFQTRSPNSSASFGSLNVLSPNGSGSLDNR